jgi:ribosomal protein S26
VSASGKSGNACTNKVNSRDVRATIPGQFVISSLFLRLQYCITTHCFVGVVSFLLSKLRFMMKFLYFFSTSACMFLLRF